VSADDRGVSGNRDHAKLAADEKPSFSSGVRKRPVAVDIARAVAPAPPVACRPFLKWAGGKRQLLPALLPRAPARFRTYFEPFVGGGALYFALQPARAVLADTNARLIRTYRGLRDHVDRVVALLKTYPHDADFFYRMREDDIDSRSDAHVAAWFIYLNRIGYNGLYRVNRSNRFNVPFGRYVNPTICDESNLRACALALEGVDLRIADFDEALEGVRRGDFVYFDPPYDPASATASFTSYTSRGFGVSDQVRLRDLARSLKRRGVHVLLSNSATDFIRGLYADDFELEEVPATRAVNSRGSLRGAVPELVMR
jgi:DNA adenine methylase